jgi:hypothetical protein
MTWNRVFLCSMRATVSVMWLNRADGFIKAALQVTHVGEKQCYLHSFPITMQVHCRIKYTLYNAIGLSLD